VPDRDSAFGIEIGIVCWVSLGGARVPVLHGLVADIIAAVDRAYDLTARALTSGSSEGVSAIASSPAGKVIGGCVGTVVVCALGVGVVAPSIGGSPAPHQQHHVSASASKVKSLPARTAPKSPAIQGTSTRSSSGRSVPGPRSATESKAQRREAARAAEATRVKEQASGFERAANSESSSSGVAASSGQPEAVVVSPSAGETAGAQRSEEAAQAEQQFGAFK
jgi:hypothetical protein